MATRKKKPAAAAKKIRSRKKSGKAGNFSLKNLLWPLFLAFLFFFSLGLLIYVVFFRIVVIA